METLLWLFEGVGTALLTFALGLLVGGTTGYKFAIKKIINKQSQKAGPQSTQTQIGVIKHDK